MKICQSFFLPENLKNSSYRRIEWRLGLDRPGLESLWGRDFLTRPDRTWGPLILVYNGYRVISGGKTAVV